MSKADKLREKLKHGKIDSREAANLLKQAGWAIDRQNGSHQIWARGKETFSLATHGKELKRYQIKAIQEAVFNEGEKEEN